MNTRSRPAQLCSVVDESPGVQLRELLQQLTRNARTSASEILSQLLHQAHHAKRAIFDEIARHRMEWEPVIAGIVAARQGDAFSLRAHCIGKTVHLCFRRELVGNFLGALEHILYQRPEAAAALSLDAIDQILLRRCEDALNGDIHIPSELALAIPIAGELSRVLGAAQNNEPSSALARTLEKLAEYEAWRQLPNPLRRILGGDRDPGITAELTPGNAVIISALLGHLATP